MEGTIEMKNISFKVSVVGWNKGGGVKLALSIWGLQSGFPYGECFRFRLFQICINGPLKEAQLLKTADSENGGGEL